ncbi:hypothetical protein AU210_001296 [Fusarium oxysporum f. sp. radicis-cucumerinum]|nr:hypothetical protein AU210_001296 [Fusarium oxysporum f. sp. radicis-cucumerinum]
MIANKLTILTATAALLEPALALGHRHAHHQHAQKRGDWVVATIDGQVAKPSQAAKSAYEPASQPKKEETAAKASQKAAIKEKTQSKAKSSSTQSKSSGSTSGGSAGFSHKRGVCYNNVDLANTFAGDCKNCGWGYNWDSSSGGLKGLNFIPTLWNDQPLHTDRFADNCAQALS